MKIAIQGLGKMGGQIARKISESREHEVVGWDIDETLIRKLEKNQIIGVRSRAELISQFKNEVVVLWLMLPATVVDEEIRAWIKILPKDSIIIDGGNSNFRNTQKNNKRILRAGMKFIDIGVSGGIWGYERGFAMTCGTDKKEAYEKIKPILDILAKPNGKHALVGRSGAGHYAKMVHNAIEYGMMQSLAEGYHLLHEHTFGENGIDLVATTNVWRHESVINSWLNDLASDIIAENPDLENIDGYVSENNGARWALEAGKAQNIAMPAIQSALDVRIRSQKGEVSYATKLLAILRFKFGGHNLNGDKRE